MNYLLPTLSDTSVAKYHFTSIERFMEINRSIWALDTLVLLWIVTDDTRISETVRKIYLNQQNEIFLSVASIWEMAIKISLP